MINKSSPIRQSSIEGRSRPVENSRSLYIYSTRSAVSPVGNRLWVIIWSISLLMIFEVQIRGIGHDGAVSLIKLFGPIGLADAGLLVPVMIVFLSSRFFTRLFKERLLVAYLLIFLYGLIIGIIRGNWFSAITSDIRIMLALFCGYYLASFIPRRLSTLAASLVVTSTLTIAISLWATLTSSYYDAILTRGGYDSAGIILLGVTICWIAPGIILATLAGNRALILLSWLNAGLSLYYVAGIMKTRTLSFSFLLTVLMAIIVVLAISRFTKKSVLMPRVKLNWVVVFVFLMLAVLVWQKGSINLFMDRVNNISTLSKLNSELNWIARTDEVTRAFGSMRGLDYVLGMGIGAQKVGPLGIQSSSLHIAILVAWWKFGFIIFLGVVWLIIRMVIRFIQSVGSVYFRRFRFKQWPLIICAPGAITLAFSACFSGGWATSSLLSLGILWGVYRALINMDLEFPGSTLNPSQLNPRD